MMIIESMQLGQGADRLIVPDNRRRNNKEEKKWHNGIVHTCRTVKDEKYKYEPTYSLDMSLDLTQFVTNDSRNWNMSNPDSVIQFSQTGKNWALQMSLPLSLFSFCGFLVCIEVVLRYIYAI